MGSERVKEKWNRDLLLEVKGEVCSEKAQIELDK